MNMNSPSSAASQATSSCSVELSARSSRGPVAAVRAGVDRLPVAVREGGLVLAGALALTLIGQIGFPLPFSPVPVTLGTFAALGVGGLLGGKRAVTSVALYALAAAVGLPVLAGWNTGIGATFGYVIGFALAAAVAGRATAPRTRCEGGSVAQVLRSVVTRMGLMVLASALVYVPGLLWLHAVTGMAWGMTLSVGFVPFIIGDLVKSVAAGLLPARR